MFKTVIHSRIKQVTVFMGATLIHSLIWFVQITDSFRIQTKDCLYDWVTESLPQLICSKQWFIHELNKWLSLWVQHWIIHFTDLFKTLIQSETKQVTILMIEYFFHILKHEIWVARNFLWSNQILINIIKCISLGILFYWVKWVASITLSAGDREQKVWYPCQTAMIQTNLSVHA